MKIFIWIVFFIIGQFLYRAINDAINKIKYAKEYLMHKDFIKYAEGIYDDYLSMFNDETFDREEKEYIFSSMDLESSRHNFIKVINFVFFNKVVDISTGKLKLNSNNIELCRKYFDCIKDIKLSELDGILGKFYIGTVLFFHYNLDNLNLNKKDKYIKREMIDAYSKSIQHSAFNKIRLNSYSEVEYRMSDKITDRYYNVVKNCFNNYHSIYTFDFASSLLVSNWKKSEDSDIRKYNSIEDFELKARNLDIVGDVKGFEDIISDNKKISLAFVNDLKMSNFNTSYCKILMYYDIERHSIEFKDYIKESEDDNYHTTKKYNNVHNLEVIKYMMYLYLGFFMLYLK